MGRFLQSSAFAASLALSLGLAPLAVASPAPDDNHTGGMSLTEMDRLIKERGEHSSQQVRVLVMLKNQPTSFSDSSEQQNKGQQSELIEKWAKKYHLEVGRQLGFLVNGFAATMPANKIPALQQEPEVASVKRERTFEKLEHNARKMQGVVTAHERHGLDGAGTVVSIIDSGIDPRHKDLQLSEDECKNAKISPDTTHNGLFTCKVPAGYNFADDNYDIIDKNESEHGQHVSGIVAANGSARDDVKTPDVVANNSFDGVAPKAQLLAMKVFPNNPKARANDSDIIAAIEASVKLKADIINMSLGSPNGNRNASDGVYRAIEKAREAGTLVVVAAGNEGKNFSPNGETDNVLHQLDDATLGSPAADTGAFAVASIDNQVQVVPVATWKAGESGTETDLPHKSATGKPDGEFHEVVDLGFGQVSDFTAEKKSALKGKFALIQRGRSTFADMFERSFEAGAVGVLVYNDKARGDEFIGMGGVETYTQFSASTYHSVGAALTKELQQGRKVFVKFTDDRKLTDFAGKKALRPSSFTSWGPTPTLDFAPHISGVGGEVYSTQNDNRYVSMSGTSMAAPNVAGLSALMWQYYEEKFPTLTGTERIDRIRAALMNTAEIPTNEDKIPYAPRQVGAGLARVDQAIESPVIATVNGQPYVSLKQVHGATSFTVTLHNYGDKAATYSVPKQQVINEVEGEKGAAKTVVSQEKLTSKTTTVTVPAGSEANVTFTLVPEQGKPHYIEGWAQLTGNKVPNIAIPYLGFVGDWNAEKIIEAPDVEWGKPVERDIYTGLATLREDLITPIGLLNDISQESEDERDLTLWMSPNGDQMQDVIFPQLLVRRNASDVEYEIVSEDGKIHQTTGKQQDLRRLTLKNFMDPQLSDDDVVENASAYAFDGKIYDAQNVKYTNVPDGKYVFQVKARVSPEYDWQVTKMPFGIDTTSPSITFNKYDEAEGLVYFTVKDTGSGVQVAPVVDTDSETNLVAERVNDSDTEFRIEVSPETTHVLVTAGDMAANITSASYILDPAAKLSVSFARDMNAHPVGPIQPYVTMLGEPEGAKLIVDGYVSDDVDHVTINGQPAELEDRNFYEYVPLTPGKNNITVVAYNAAGLEVSKLDLTPFYDNEPPKLVVNRPAPIEGNIVTVRGTITDSNKDAQLSVLVNGELADLKADGTFESEIEVSDELQTVTVVGSDGAQRVSEVVPIQGRGADVPPAPPLPGGPAIPPPPLPGDGFISSASLPTIDNAQCAPELAICAVPTDTKDYDRENKVFTVRGTLNASTIAKFQLVPTGRAGDNKVIEPKPLVANINRDTGEFSLQIPASTGQSDFRLELYVPGEKADRPVLTKSQSFKLLIDVNVPEIHIDQPITLGGSIFTQHDEVVFTGNVSDDGWGYKFLINKDTVEQRENNSGLGAESNEREFTYPVKVKDGDKILVTVIDSFGNQILGVYPVVVDKDKPTVDATYADNKLMESTVVGDDTPINVTANDTHLRSLKVKLDSIDGTEVLNEEAHADIDVTERNVEDLMADVREIRETALARLEATGMSKPANADSDSDVADADTAQKQPTVENQVFVSGSQTTVKTRDLAIPIDTEKLSAGLYTMTILADDLAGNQTAQAVTFAVDRLPQIVGPDAVDVELTKEQLRDNDSAAKVIFANFSITDDGSADFAGDGSGVGEAHLLIDPATVLMPGKNTVLVRAVQPNGLESHKLITVNISVKEDSQPEQKPQPDTQEGSGSNGGTTPQDPMVVPGTGSGSVFGTLAAGSHTPSHSVGLAATGSYAGTLALLASLTIAGGMVLNRRARMS
ncbi:S8 family serine peptidase [Arcanobacterium phocae]|uniref:S8 family serine peptidase n=1 Tax=Arcanobacterium phocae TaxID=131112 RepID=UPI001C0EE928|nr:S8 family serine peptidase [Arcanobacterium phocae]